MSILLGAGMMKIRHAMVVSKERRKSGGEVYASWAMAPRSQLGEAHYRQGFTIPPISAGGDRQACNTYYG
jgi:hypothetical protein